MDALYDAVRAVSGCLGEDVFYYERAREKAEGDEEEVVFVLDCERRSPVEAFDKDGGREAHDCADNGGKEYPL